MICMDALRLLASLANAISEALMIALILRSLNEDLAEDANVTPFTVSRSSSDWGRSGLSREKAR
jgi:hypothetical protein